MTSARTVTRWVFRGGLFAAALVAGGPAVGRLMAIPPPPEPAYPFLIPGGPGAAWVEARGGDRWLPVNSLDGEWCPGLGQPCASNSRPGVPPPGGICNIDRDRMPTVRLRPGEQVRFHLPFTPTSVNLTLRAKSYAPDGGSVPQWPANSLGGPATLAVQAAMGRVSYRAWLAITRDRVPARISRRPGRLRPGEPLTVETDQTIRLRGCIRSLPVARGFKKDISLRRIEPGPHLIAVGRLPPGRYSVRFEARDLEGNLTRQATTFAVKT